MPIYEYKCQLCGEVSDHHCKMADRMTRRDCPICSKEACADLQMSAPLLGTERIVGDARIIKDEREVIANSARGVDWRDEGTTGKPGGAGRKTIFHG